MIKNSSFYKNYLTKVKRFILIKIEYKFASELIVMIKKIRCNIHYVFMSMLQKKIIF